MNWKTRLSKPKTGDKVKIMSRKKSSHLYTIGQIYTLKTHYIENGVWKHYSTGSTWNNINDNYWDTEEFSANGLEERDFIRV